MNKIYQYSWQSASFFFLAAFILLYPFYKYVFDVDAIGYLSVAHHYANGDLQKAVNGYWSPLHCWLIAPFLKMGANEFTAFKWSNAFFSIGILYFFNRILKKFSFSGEKSFFVLLASAALLLYFAFSELAADLLQCFLLFIYTSIILSDRVFADFRKSLFCGFIAALAYFAKAYTLPFFVLHFLVVQIILYKTSTENHKLQQLFRNLLAAYGILAMLSIPWMLLLHAKYEVWTISTAGKLNQSWYLIPGIHNDSIFFLPPPHQDSAGWWEDPFFTQGKFYTPFSSFESFIQELKVIRHNLKEFFFTGLRISVLTPFIFAGTFFALSRHSVRWKIILTTFFILPAGYLLIHFENRFIWILDFLFILCGAQLIEWWSVHYHPPVALRKVVYVLLFTSFIIHPVIGLKNLYMQDKNVFEFAAEIRNQGVKGKMTSNDPGTLLQKTAYLTDNSFYRTAKLKYNYTELLTNMRKEGIKYYFLFYDYTQQLNDFKNSPLYTGCTEVIFNYPQVILLKLK